ncbi:MAG: prepilin-type N-terminal cleavage/methylation domain-containing protein [Sedimentisphaerales bacterium]
MTEDRRQNSMGGSVKCSLAMANAGAFGFEAATQQSTSDKRRAMSRGFTLAEAMMATVVLGIAAAGVLLPFTSGARVRAEGMRRTLAANLASDLMEEIIRTEFDQIITKYGTYAELQGHIISDFFTKAEFTDPMYANFSRDASCTYVYVPQQSGSVESNFIRVTVRVYYNGSQIATINRLISK